MTSRNVGVECQNCHASISRPIWTFVALALILPIWGIWYKFVDPPFHLGIYGLEVAMLWGLVVLVLSPLKTDSKLDLTDASQALGD